MRTVPLCEFYLRPCEALDEFADEITVVVHDCHGVQQYTTLGGIMDDHEWVEGGSETVFVWISRAIAAVQQGLALRDLVRGAAYRGCLACHHDGHLQCVRCWYCESHDCGGGCPEQKLADDYGQIDSWAAYADEVTR